jgi:hypothetical protein
MINFFILLFEKLNHSYGMYIKYRYTLSKEHYVHTTIFKSHMTISPFLTLYIRWFDMQRLGYQLLTRTDTL